MPEQGLANVEQAIESIARGGIVVVVDANDREDEGDLVMAADLTTPEALAFFLQHTSGLICVSLSEARTTELRLPMMVDSDSNTEAQGTAFTVTVDFRPGVSTGISVRDRAETIRALCSVSTEPEDLARPGHMHVLRARSGGVLVRPGHTEAAIDLARLAGRYPAGVLCEIVSPDGLAMARGAELEQFAAAYDLPIVSIADLIAYRRRTERHVERLVETNVSTDWGPLNYYRYLDTFTGDEAMVFVKGAPGAHGAVVALRTECVLGDVFGGNCCGCKGQLAEAMEAVAESSNGVLIYLRSPRTPTLVNANPDRPVRTSETFADTRPLGDEHHISPSQHESAAQILVDLGLRSPRPISSASSFAETLRTWPAGQDADGGVSAHALPCCEPEFAAASGLGVALVR